MGRGGTALAARVSGYAAAMARRFEIVAVIAEVQEWSVAVDGDDVPLVVRVEPGAPATPPDGWRRIDVDLGDLGDYYATDEIAARIERFEQELLGLQPA